MFITCKEFLFTATSLTDVWIYIAGHSTEPPMLDVDIIKL